LPGRFVERLPHEPPSRGFLAMLSLQSATTSRWLAQVRAHLPEILIDHAHCEKKAASTAMNLIFAYVDQVPLVLSLSEIVTEELTHFRMVLDVLQGRGIPFRRLKPARYGQQLADLVRREEPNRAVDRMLVAALIEARSCERFDLLRRHVEDRELADVYDGLFESEARHHSSYVQMACRFADEDVVRARLAELSAAESQIVAEGDPLPRMHS
jgi:tRNA-(ms[2]io[6]A)-hydroxylase